ncbi:ribosome biogenesis GTPase Der [Candidatus Falkowbacteria bacterium]|nr:ribosome biogenesis GTPase Der [Candidatus Falkowbacteria bacterium]
MKKLPTVALIGRTNVGKSTLFNRLIGQRKALTSPEAGTTRDRNIGVVEWRDKEFYLVDTGGLDLGYLPKTKLPKKLKLTERVNPDDLIETNIVKQATIAIKQADFIIMVVDGAVGLQVEDQTVRNILRKSGKSHLLLANKIDRQSQRHDIWQFSRLGLGQAIPVSAITGVGTGDMLDSVIKKLKFSRGQPEPIPPKIKVAIMGQPNVGKSSLLNSILGEERVIVSPIAHTTREAQDIDFAYHDKHFTLIDTAGIRRRAKIRPGVEKAGVTDSLHSLQAADVALLILDVSKDLSVQDAKIAREITDGNVGLIIVANKWDLIADKKTGAELTFTKYFQRYFPALAWAPVIFVSAKSGQRVKKILDLAIDITAAREQRVPDKELEILLKRSIKRHLPAQSKGNIHPYIYGLSQTSINPPRFVLLIHPKAEIHKSYVRYLENQIRQDFGFIGTPIIVHQRFYKK